MKKILLGMIVCLSAMLFTSCGGPSTPEEVAKAYHEAMAQGNIDKAVDLMYFKSLKDDQKKAFVEMMKGQIKEEDIEKSKNAVITTEAAEIAEDGETAKVKVTVTLEGEDPDTDTVKLIKVDGKWYVNSGK